MRGFIKSVCRNGLRFVRLSVTWVSPWKKFPRTSALARVGRRPSRRTIGVASTPARRIYKTDLLLMVRLACHYSRTRVRPNHIWIQRKAETAGRTKDRRREPQVRKFDPQSPSFVMSSLHRLVYALTLLSYLDESLCSLGMGQTRTLHGPTVRGLTRPLAANSRSCPT